MAALLTFLIGSICLMFINKNNRQLFVLCSILPALILFILIYNLPDLRIIKISNYLMHFSFTSNDKLLAYAFTIILLINNIYVAAKGYASEVIAGTLYAIFTIIGIFTADFITLIFTLEIMMLLSAYLIYQGSGGHNINNLRQYFITHLISGNMIIVGAACLFIETGSLEIVNLSNILLSSTVHNSCYYIMLLGALINVAMFPFSGWMSNCYASAPAVSFPYLISYTSKLSIIILLKVFAGVHLLSYCGVVMIVYAGLKSVFDKNIYKYLVHSSIAQMGFMILCISSESPILQQSVYIYLFGHILYKGILSILVLILSEEVKIFYTDQIVKVKNKLFNTTLFLTTLALVQIPLTTNYFIKSYASIYYENSAYYFILIFLSFISVLALPFKDYIKSDHSENLNLNNYTKCSLSIAIFVILTLCIFGWYLLLMPTLELEPILYSGNLVKQLIIISSAILIGFFLNYNRRDIASMNLFSSIGAFVLWIYYKIEHRENIDEDKPEHEGICDEVGPIYYIERQLKIKVSYFHNQQTAIFIVISMFMYIFYCFIESI